MTVIKIVLIDDHDIVRTGVKAFLEQQSDIKIIGEARSGAEALVLVEREPPDVCVMDISMEGMDGLQATQRIKNSHPSCKVLALTVHADKQHFFEMMAAGAEGYVTKHSAAEDLVDAIRAVAGGEVYLQPTLARWLLEDYRRISTSPLDDERPAQNREQLKSLEILSPREKQVIELVAEGYNNKEIGEMLGISPKTVARHRERIMNKLDIHSCVELVKFAVRTGLIDVDK